ncbi:MAG: hypothetical protein RLZZ230_152 [Candidatus Parcubacteria bacterium]|jgi:hypothetical protein
MKNSLKTIVGGLLCVLLIGPVSAQAKSTIDTEVTYRMILLELIDVLQKQITLLQAELKPQPEKLVIIAVEPDSLQNAIDIEAKYIIDHPADVKNISDRQQRNYFTQVFAIFPDDYDAKLSQLEVFKKGDSLIDAFVETVPPTNDTWLFAVADDILTDSTSVESTELIVHELGHLVSYEQIVGIPTPSYTSCHNYFSSRGCPAENSYLVQFTNHFWSDTDLTRISQFNNREDTIDAASLYYKKHPSQFVSDYAAFSPEEDFSESFMYFIFNKPTSGTTAKQKLNFFAQYPELVNMRNEIQSALK